MAFQDYIEIPNNNKVFAIGNDEVDILQKGVYEITFCGQINWRRSRPWSNILFN